MFVKVHYNVKQTSCIVVPNKVHELVTFEQLWAENGFNDLSLDGVTKALIDMFKTSEIIYKVLNIAPVEYVPHSDKKATKNMLTICIYNQLYDHCAHFYSVFESASKYHNFDYEEVRDKVFLPWYEKNKAKIVVASNFIKQLQARSDPRSDWQADKRHEERVKKMHQQKPVKDEKQRCLRCKFVHDTVDWYFCKEQSCMHWNDRKPQPSAGRNIIERSENSPETAPKDDNKITLLADYGNRSGDGWQSEGVSLESYVLSPTATVQNFRYLLQDINNKSIFIVEWVNYGNVQLGKVYTDGDVAHVERREFMKTD